MWGHSICLLLSDCLYISDRPPPRPPSLVSWGLGSVLADSGHSSVTSYHASHEPPLETHWDVTSSSTCGDNCTSILIILAEMHCVESCGIENAKRLLGVPAGCQITFFFFCWIHFFWPPRLNSSFSLWIAYVSQTFPIPPNRALVDRDTGISFFSATDLSLWELLNVGGKTVHPARNYNILISVCCCFCRAAQWR